MDDRSDHPVSRVPLVQVDAFTERPFAGNPAAVCLLREERADRWLQAVAAEMNLSETSFPLPLEPTKGDYALRWFTPTTEVDLCGHATLASAHALWETGRVDAGRPIRFRTRSGVLTCERTASGAAEPETIWMDFPAEPPRTVDAGTEDRGSILSAALGAEPVRVARNRFDLVVELASEEAVRGLRPDLVRLSAVEARGVIVTAAAAGGADHDFVSRFFGPRVGVPEDPVTGSAHCALAPWWSERLGRERLVGYQASPRGGIVHTVLQGDRVRLGGHAVTVFAGELYA